jgi:transposase
MRLSNSRSLAATCLDLSEDLVSQPLLFDRDLLPVEVPILRAAKRLNNTGKIASRDEATAMAIAVCKLAGLGNAETAKRVGVSHHTVRTVLRILEDSGRIPSASQRLASQLGEMAESASNEIAKLIDEADGAWTPASAGAVRALGVAVGIAVDKHQLLTGQATAIVEQRVGAPSADAVREWEAKLRQVFGPVIDLETSPTDSQSDVILDNSLLNNTSEANATHIATRSAAQFATHDLPEVACPGGGGGCPAAAAGETTRDSIE